MALTSNGWWLSLSVMDNGGDVTTKKYQLTSADAAAAATDSATIIAAFDGVSDAPVFSYHTYEEFVESLLVLPASGVENQNQALLVFDIVGHPEKRASISIPAASPGIFQTTTGAGAKRVDTADAAVIAYRDLFRTGGEALISDGEVASSLIEGHRRHVAKKDG